MRDHIHSQIIDVIAADLPREVGRDLMWVDYWPIGISVNQYRDTWTVRFKAIHEQVHYYFSITVKDRRKMPTITVSRTSNQDPLRDAWDSLDDQARERIRQELARRDRTLPTWAGV